MASTKYSSFTAACFLVVLLLVAQVSCSEESDTSKLKKAITKKPTQLIKQKPLGTIPVKVSSSPSGLPPVDTSSTVVVPVSSSTHSTTPSVHSTSTTEGPFSPEDVTLPPNSTESEDHHMYYNSTVISEADGASIYWANFTAESGVEHMTHEMLSNSHRRAATVQLKFKFPFYGHPIQNVTIATGGFLYLGDTVHSWLAATQYIAPLMANFDTSISNASSIKYVNNQTHFIVQWNDVQLQDSNPPGNFSFQVALHKEGDIVFAYRELPMSVEAIPDAKHPVKVGISDAYVIDRTVFFIRRKTIYEYHRADLKKENITNNTAIYFKALPTCVSLTSCDACVSSKLTFDCKWCDAVQRCSDGFDRHRQDWLVRGCDGDLAVKDQTKCKAPEANSTASSAQSNPHPAIPGERQKNEQQHGDSSWNKYDKIQDQAAPKSGHGAKVGAVTLLVIVALLSGVGLWVFWAYKNPQTGAGQFLIKYRVSEWNWRPTETRYTAASIHM